MLCVSYCDRSQALREKTSEEKAGGQAPGVPPGFTSPTLNLPGIAADAAAPVPPPAAAAGLKAEEEDVKEEVAEEEAVEV